jgi:hypothetical protein
MKLASLIAVAGFAAAAAAQGTLTYSWSVSDTGNGDGIIEQGEAALLTMIGTMDPGATGIAGTIYDIVGLNNWDTGTVSENTNHLAALTDHGQLQGNGDIMLIESFQLPPAFNPDFDPSNPITLYTLTWTPNDYTNRIVSVGDSNHLNNDVYTDDFGTSVAYTGVTGTVEFSVVPAPASLALLGLGGLVAGRRRR